MKSRYSDAIGQKMLMAESMGQDPSTYIRKIDLSPGDYGADPIGNNQFRMVPSGDVVSADEKNARLGARTWGASQ